MGRREEEKKEEGKLELELALGLGRTPASKEEDRLFSFSSIFPTFPFCAPSIILFSPFRLVIYFLLRFSLILFYSILFIHIYIIFLIHTIYSDLYFPFSSLLFPPCLVPISEPGSKAKGGATDRHGRPPAAPIANSPLGRIGRGGNWTTFRPQFDTRYRMTTENEQLRCQDLKLVHQLHWAGKTQKVTVCVFLCVFSLCTHPTLLPPHPP